MGFFKRLLGREEANWQTSAAGEVPQQPQQPQQQPIITGNVQSHVLTGDEARQAMQGIETMMNMDLDGDGRIGTGAAPAAFREPPEADHLSQLERLVKLRDSGALTPEEFEREKAKLLDG